MNLPYPQSIPCSFDNFPVALDIRLGKLAGSLISGASLGSKLLLYRTPKCGVAQGDYVTGQALPEYRMIYSDTGSDDDFNFKMSFIGYGTFYKITSADQYLRFQVFKAIAIETAAAGELVFGDTFDCETLIPADTDTTALFNYDGSIVQYSDTVTTTGSGTFWLNGQEYHLADGQSITITSATGGTNTFTFVGNTLVVS